MAWRLVIVVEDDVMVAKALEISLRGFGIEVVIFARGEDLLAHPLALEADFYLSDFRLPGLNGLEVLDAIQMRSARPIHAVLLTGDTSPERIRLTASSHWPVLYKPIDLASLLALMNEALAPVH
jgi:CheY-like chemotaxis protein